MTEPTPTKAPTSLILLAAWGAVGLLGGLVEVLMLGVKKYILGSVLWLGPHTAWMAPAASAVTAIAIGLPFVLLRTVSPRAVSVRGQVFFAVVLAVSGAVSVFPIHLAAALVLGAGIAVHASRWAAAPGHARYLVTSVAPWALAVWAAVFLTVNGSHAIREWRGYRGEAPIGDFPNVLVVTVDTERAASLSLYGNERPTSPVRDALAASSVVFDLAFATSSWTLPSHGTILTGRYPDELSADWTEPLDDTHLTLAEYFTARGYATAAFTANATYSTREFGVDRGFSRFEGLTPSFGEFVLSTEFGRTVGNSRLVRRLFGFHDILGRKSGEKLTRDFLDWEEARPSDRPFLAWLNYYDTHDLYLPPSPYDTMFADPDSVWTYESVDHRLRGYHGDAWPQERPTVGAIRAYEGAVAYVDAQIDALIRTLDARGLLDRTIVVLTSDHGELFGEHGLVHHGNSLYTQVLQVPLLIRYPPAAPSGVRIASAVSLRDLARTVVDLAGVDGDAAAFPGTSLARLWDDAADPGASPVYATLTLPNGVILHSLVVDDRWHYISVIRRGRTFEEVYDLQTDPFEAHDLAKTLEIEAMLPDLRRRMELAGGGREDAAHAAIGRSNP